MQSQTTLQNSKVNIENNKIWNKQTKQIPLPQKSPELHIKGNEFSESVKSSSGLIYFYEFWFKSLFLLIFEDSFVGF